ncbi:MAG TPA: VWA domain-containing protein [Bryobacteraceae bacterium]|nr:VWA domain-containing protein [Bryobacteraceae bacterium]
MPRRLLALTAILAAFSDIARSESPQRLVRLTVTATDSKGNAVTDLQRDEIAVHEDGKSYPLVFFRFSGLTRDLAPAGAENSEIANHSEPAPTFVLLDRWNDRLTSAATAWSDVTNALRHLESVERVYVYFLTNHGELVPVHPLPATDADLRRAPQPSPAELAAKLDDAFRAATGFRDTAAQDPLARVNTTIQTLTALGEQMASVAGRKNLLWITHGIPLRARLLNGDWADFAPRLQLLCEAAARSQIAIYTVDQSAAGVGANPIAFARQTLEMLTSLTGGRWYDSGNSTRAFSGVMTDSRGSYRLAYYAPIRERPGERKIHVTSTRKGIHLLTRDAYLNETADPPADLVAEAALGAQGRSPFDAAEIALRVSLTRNPAAKTIHLAIRINPSDLVFEHTAEKYQASLSVMTASYADGFLKQTTAPVPVHVSLTQDQLDLATKNGLSTSQDFPIPQAIQKIRVIVFDRALYALGSVTIPIN